MDKVTGSQVDCTSITLSFLSNLEDGILTLRLTDQMVVNSDYYCTSFCLKGVIPRFILIRTSKW